jgi:hypothetical protein
VDDLVLIVEARRGAHCQITTLLYLFTAIQAPSLFS